MRLSRISITLGALPSILMLALFYSLALHMYHSLDGWPTSIGERGFAASLKAHAVFTVHYFVAMFFSAWLSPLAIVACAFLKRARYWTVFFAAHISSFFIGWALMQLAPAQFLYWWRD